MAGSDEDIAKQCPTCMKDITTGEALFCTTCYLCYHVTCTSTTPQFFRIMSSKSKDRWLCAHCRRGDKPKPVTTPKVGTPAEAKGKLPDRAKEPEKLSTPTDKVLKKVPEKPVTPKDNTLKNVPKKVVTANNKVPEHVVTPTDKSAGAESHVASIQKLLPEGMLGKIIDAVREDITHTFKNTIEQLINQQVSALADRILSRIEDVVHTVENLNIRIDGIEDRVASIEHQLAEGLTGSDNDQKQNTLIENLKSELNDRDQELLQNDLEISGIPEVAGENPINIVSLVGSKLGVNILPSDIVSAARVGARRDYAAAAAGAAAGGGAGNNEGARTPIRQIAVRLVRRAQRDALLQAARVRRTIDTSGFDLPGEPRRFYVNERLTRINRQLFWRAREEKQRLKWKFAWTRDGVILVRKDQESSVIRIRTEKDIARVFGAANVGGI
ncbi:hypothetical protein NE865_16355 [Phthorimaea operculella]|nr:hypothetical protein NE865_16355 [Phthorimaea operculella]